MCRVETNLRIFFEIGSFPGIRGLSVRLGYWAVSTRQSPVCLPRAEVKGASPNLDFCTNAARDQSQVLILVRQSPCLWGYVHSAEVDYNLSLQRPCKGGHYHYLHFTAENTELESLVICQGHTANELKAWTWAQQACISLLAPISLGTRKECWVRPWLT